jgi:hypothetical protein
LLFTLLFTLIQYNTIQLAMLWLLECSTGVSQ